VNLSAEEFTTRVRGHLSAALERVPETVPADVFDEVAQPMMDELEQLDELLYGLGYEERAHEDREMARERTVRAKGRDPELEEIAMRIDHWVAKSIEGLGLKDGPLTILHRVHADALIRSVLGLLHRFPASTFAETTPSVDPRPEILAVVTVIREAMQSASPSPTTPTED
jgi:hypothetical protein